MFKALCAEVVPLLPPKLNSRGIDPTIKICDDMNSILNVDASYSGATHDSFMWQNGELRNFRKHFENLCSTHERAALLGRWRCLLGARQLLRELETAPGECWAHGPSRSRARRCRRATPRHQPPPAPPSPPPPTLCSAQGRTVTDSYAI
ncbi:uncharacterized protein isoform X2 [Choristoneura fumiferana]|uniref:uncharacterized protein isoform X2 n=1 Tax=Choristoneura fumiferana TaxID=7141 RepID=UPI003D153920